MDFRSWQLWRGPEVANFVSNFCQLPQYSTSVSQNLTGATLHQLSKSGTLLKGLARLGVSDSIHQQRIAEGVAQLLSWDAEDLTTELRCRVALAGPRVPRGPPPTQAAPRTRLVSTAVRKDPSPPPAARPPPRCMVPDNSSFERRTPKPWGSRGSNTGVSEGDLRLRERLAVSLSDYEAMRGPVELLRTVKELERRRLKELQDAREVREKAARIQASMREKSMRKDLATEVAELQDTAALNEDAAIEQLAIDLAKGTPEEQVAAAKIQAIHRGKLARRESQETAIEREQAAAATKIQAIHRGKMARRSQVANDDKVEDSIDDVVADLAMGSPEEQAAALKIQALQRGKLARRESEALRVEREEQTAAAVKIQAIQRGKLTRRSMMSKAAQEEEVISEVVSDLAVGTPEEQAAALKIQAIQRGKLARRNLAANASEKDQPPVAVDDIIADLASGTPEEQAAAIKLQALQRGKLARRESEAMRVEREEQTAAATKIQAIHRGKKARRNMHENEQQKEALNELADYLAEGTPEEQAAALKIQAIQRGKLARRESQRMMVEKNEQAAAVTNEETIEEEQAIDEIADELATGTPEEQQAAMRIQAIQRGKKARKESELMRIEREEQTAAATKIQAIHRGKIARRSQANAAPADADAVTSDAVDQQATAMDDIGELPEEELPEGTPEEQAAAARIQAIQRGKQARRETQQKREEIAAATKIQAIHRGKQARRSMAAGEEEA
eukprot:TRINITY_DN563_c0_g1_i1.p1 TRINITY_DN563_c0_g1~~TRINITY_DN563_c0_g1_i1.p1  ORF type:complete len:735 (+),score=182.16 TRINITY_DN563_c0_g1_i1:253-2457(+)